MLYACRCRQATTPAAPGEYTWVLQFAPPPAPPAKPHPLLLQKLLLPPSQSPSLRATEGLCMTSLSSRSSHSSSSNDVASTVSFYRTKAVSGSGTCKGLSLPLLLLLLFLHLLLLQLLNSSSSACSAVAAGSIRCCCCLALHLLLPALLQLLPPLASTISSCSVTDLLLLLLLILLL